MCRLAAFPPGFSKEAALKIMDDMWGGNSDGTGSVYIDKGEFVVNRWPLAFPEVVKKDLPLFDHMPSKSWTLAHVRASTHGKNAVRNTHPFVRGEWAVVHNGVFSDNDKYRELLAATGIKFEGETDSEVAADIISRLGPVRFKSFADRDGVYLALNRQGHLYAVVTSGDFQFKKLKDHGKMVVMASELPKEYESGSIDVDEGWLRFNRKGTMKKGKYKKDKYGKANRSYGVYGRGVHGGIGYSAGGYDDHGWYDDGVGGGHYGTTTPRARTTPSGQGGTEGSGPAPVIGGADSSDDKKADGLAGDTSIGNRVYNKEILARVEDEAEVYSVSPVIHSIFESDAPKKTGDIYRTRNGSLVYYDHDKRGWVLIVPDPKEKVPELALDLDKPTKDLGGLHVAADGRRMFYDETINSWVEITESGATKVTPVDEAGLGNPTEDDEDDDDVSRIDRLPHNQD